MWKRLEAQDRIPTHAAVLLVALVTTQACDSADPPTSPTPPESPPEAADGVVFDGSGGFAAAGFPTLDGDGNLESGPWAIFLPDTVVGGTILAFQPTADNRGHLFRLTVTAPPTAGAFVCPADCIGDLALDRITDGSAASGGFSLEQGILTITSLGSGRIAGTFEVTLRSEDPDLGTIVVDDGAFDVPITGDSAAGEAACFVATALDFETDC